MPQIQNKANAEALWTMADTIKKEMERFDDLEEIHSFPNGFNLHGLRLDIFIHFSDLSNSIDFSSVSFWEGASRSTEWMGHRGSLWRSIFDGNDANDMIGWQRVSEIYHGHDRNFKMNRIENNENIKHDIRFAIIQTERHLRGGRAMQERFALLHAVALRAGIHFI